MPNKALKNDFFATFSGQNAKVRGKSLKNGFFATPPDKTHIVAVVLIDPNSSNRLSSPGHETGAFL